MAAFVRLQEALSRAKMDDLMREDYRFAFFSLPSGQQKAVTIASHGRLQLVG